MKRVIDIPDNYVERIVNDFDNIKMGSIGVTECMAAIKEGTTIPEGVRLIDANAYLEDVKKHYFDNDMVMRCTEIALSNAPTIIV